MTRKLLIFFFAAATVALITAGKHDGETILKSSGSHESCTGAPGEQTCAQAGCHVDATIARDDNNAVTDIILGNGEKTYAPATQYTIKLKATKHGVGRFGFQVVVLDTNNRSIGKFAVPKNYNRVQLQTGLVDNVSRQYVTHTTAGNKPITTGETEWQFLWTTPLNYQGKVTFYYCVNATNMDNTNSGDFLYLASPTFIAEGANAVENESAVADFRLFPTIASDYLTIENESGFGDNTEYAVVSAGGMTLQKNLLGNGNSVAVIPLASLPNGVYSLIITAGKSVITKRFVVVR